MLSVPNRATWEAFFQQSLISNCDVKIYDLANNVICDKNNITSFSLKSNNDYICSSSPRTNCSIDIDLTSFTTPPTFTKKQWVTITFTVEGVETGGFILIIDDIVTSRQSTKTTLKLVDYFTSQTQKQPIPQTRLGSETFYNAIPSGAKSLPVGVTITEGWQQYALYKRTGLKSKVEVGLFGIITMVPDYIVFSPTAMGNYDALNIYDDYEYTLQDDNQTLQVFGIEPSSTTITIFSGNVEGGGVFLFTYTNFDKSYVVTNIVVGGYTSGWRFSSGVASQHNFTLGSYVMTVYGYEAVLSEIPDGVDKYVSTYTVETGSADALAIQNYIRDYYANNKTISFKCRIDPTIEPLDIIEMNLDEGNKKIVVEEVGINFNGGFTGSIKGRVLRETQSIVASNMTTQFEVGEAFSFGGTVEAVHDYGANTDVTSSCTFTGYDMNVVGTQTVTVSYTEDGITHTTTYQITVNAIQSPVVVSTTLTSNWNIKIQNPNALAKTLYVDCSQGEVTFNVNGGETITLNNNNASILSDSISAKRSGQLADDITAWFYEGGSVVIVVEADY